MSIDNWAATLLACVTATQVLPSGAAPPPVVKLNTLAIDKAFRGKGSHCQQGPWPQVMLCERFDVDGTYRRWIVEPTNGMIQGRYKVENAKIDITVGNRTRSYEIYSDKQGNLYRMRLGMRQDVLESLPKLER